jgi:hypothetical protein
VKKGRRDLLWIEEPAEDDAPLLEPDDVEAHPGAGRVSPGPRAGMTLRAGLAAAITVLAALTYSYISLLRSGTLHIQQSDFLVYYAAAHLVLSGHGHAIYAVNALRHIEAGFLPASTPPRAQAAFLYPPFAALLLAPLAALPFAAAYFLWLALNAALAVASAATLQRYIGLGGSRGLLWVLLSLSFFPIFAGLVQGQIAVLLLAAATCALVSFLAGRDELGGAALAVLLIKPPYCLPFLLLLLAQRRWRGLLSFGGVGIFLALAPSAVLGPGSDLGYARLLLAAARWHTAAGGFSPVVNHNLSGLTQLLLPRAPALAAQLVLTAGVLLGLAVLAWRRNSIEVPFAAAVVVALLINPHVLIHDLALLLVPAAIALRYREAGTLHLAVILSTLYLAALEGPAIVRVVPLQLTAVGMICLLGWLLVAPDRPPASSTFEPAAVPADPRSGEGRPLLFRLRI